MTTELAKVTNEEFDTIVYNAECAVRHTADLVGAKLSSEAAEKLGDILNDFLVEHVCYVEE